MCPLYQYTVLTASFVAEKNPLAGAVPAPLARSAGHASIRSRGRTKRRPCPAWAGGGPASGSKIFFSKSGSAPGSPCDDRRVVAENLCDGALSSPTQRVPLSCLYLFSGQRFTPDTDVAAKTRQVLTLD
jgi:hypothetical protein